MRAKCERRARGWHWGAPSLREKEAALVEMEERLRQAADESHAWCGLARSNEAATSGLIDGRARQ